MAETSQQYPEELLESADALMRLVAAGKEFTPTIQRLTELAVHAINSADDCSISLSTSDHEVRTVATTSDVAARLDDLQQETGEGPCLSSIEDHETFYLPDLNDDDTWPNFSKRAAKESGFKSILSYVLRLPENATGAMNMFSTKMDAFSAQDVETGTLFAAQAAVALTHALTQRSDRETIAQLEQGMRTRQMIGQAVGILMKSRGINADEAFQVLKRVSQDSNTKLHDIAGEVVDRAQDV